MNDNSKDNSTNQDLISVIIPVYNGKDYVRDCISSVQNQSYKNLEIIVVDDASTDDSLRICNDLAAADSRIKLFHLDKNGGQSVARNFGVSKATGNWIGFIDNDDTMEPEMLQTLLDNAQKHNVKVSGCANKRIEPDKTIIADINGKPSGKYNTDEIVLKILYKPAYTWTEIWNKIYHKSLKGQLKFPEGAQLEDYLVVLPLLYNVKECYFDNRPMYNWIIRETSQSDQLFFENRMTYLSTTEKLRNWFIGNKAEQKFIDAVYVWEYGVKCKLLQDMVKTKNPNNIKRAKELLQEVKTLKKHVKINKEFTIKSYLHCELRLLHVKLAN